MTFNTVLLGVAVVATSALLAVPLGVFRALFRVPFAPLWDVLLLVPFMIPPYIATLGWIMTLQPRGYLHQLAGFHLAPFLFSLGGMTLIMALNTFPVVYFAVSRTVEAVGARYSDVARLFGATPARAFWRVTLPLAAPGLTASLLLVFAMAIEEYGTPAALGRRAGFEVLVSGIDLRVSDWPIDLPGAAVISLVLVFLSFLAFLLQRRILAGRSFETTVGKPHNKDKRPLGALAVPVVALFAIVAFLATGVPLLAVLATAAQKTISGGLVPGNLGLQNFQAIFADAAGGLHALGLSLSLGVATALLAGLLGALSAYVVVKTRTPGRRVIDVLTVLPNALPGIVVAVGLILAWNQPCAAGHTLQHVPDTAACLLLHPAAASGALYPGSSAADQRQSRGCRARLRGLRHDGTPPDSGSAHHAEPDFIDAAGLCCRLARTGGLNPDCARRRADGRDLHLAAVRAGLDRPWHGHGLSCHRADNASAAACPWCDARQRDETGVMAIRPSRSTSNGSSQDNRVMMARSASPKRWISSIVL